MNNYKYITIILGLFLAIFMVGCESHPPSGDSNPVEDATYRYDGLFVRDFNTNYCRIESSFFSSSLVSLSSSEMTAAFLPLK